MNQLQVFQNNQFGEVRVAKTESNEPLFCLADICKILDLQTNKVKERLSEKGWNTIPTLTSGGTQNLIYINESNFYKSVFQSRKPEAEAFTEWVTSEVLPTIRKHGAYMNASVIEKALTDPDTIIQLATNLKEERMQRQILQQQAELQANELKQAAPKVQYYNNVLSSNTLQPINVIANDLGLTAIALNKLLVKLRVQYKSGGCYVLYAPFRDMGLAKHVPIPYTDSNGNPKTAQHLQWFEAGKKFIIEMVQKHAPQTKQTQWK